MAGPYEHIVPPQTEPERIDKYASMVLGYFASRSQARKAAKRGDLTLNGNEVESSRYIRPGDHIVTRVRHGTPHRNFELQVTVVYEDDTMAVVDKPAGIPVSGNRHRTLERTLPYNLKPTTQLDPLPIPRPAHRLDVPTGGLVLVGKTATAMVGLGRQFEARTIQKRYRALLVGKLDGQGTVDRQVDDRPSTTRYKAVDHTRTLHCDWVTTVDLWPETGRTHQLRQHMAWLGHPVLGDTTYGVDGKIFHHNGLFLRAVELTLCHPVTGEPLHVEIKEAHKFESYRAREARRWQRHNSEPG